MDASSSDVGTVLVKQKQLGPTRCLLDLPNELLEAIGVMIANDDPLSEMPETALIDILHERCFLRSEDSPEHLASSIAARPTRDLCAFKATCRRLDAAVELKDLYLRLPISTLGPRWTERIPGHILRAVSQAQIELAWGIHPTDMSASTWSALGRPDGFDPHVAMEAFRPKIEQLEALIKAMCNLKTLSIVFTCDAPFDRFDTTMFRADELSEKMLPVIQAHPSLSYLQMAGHAPPPYSLDERMFLSVFRNLIFGTSTVNVPFADDLGWLLNRDFSDLKSNVRSLSIPLFGPYTSLLYKPRAENLLRDLKRLDLHVWPRHDCKPDRIEWHRSRNASYKFKYELSAILAPFTELNDISIRVASGEGSAPTCACYRNAALLRKAVEEIAIVLPKVEKVTIWAGSGGPRGYSAGTGSGQSWKVARNVDGTTTINPL